MSDSIIVKWFFIFILFTCSVYLSAQTITPDFLTGVWQSINSEDIEFEVEFMVEDGFVSGQICSLTKNTSRIDCAADEEEMTDCGFQFPFQLHVARFRFDFISCHSMKKGQGILLKHQNWIIWNCSTIEGQYKVDHLIPDLVILKKQEPSLR